MDLIQASWGRRAPGVLLPQHGVAPSPKIVPFLSLWDKPQPPNENGCCLSCRGVDLIPQLNDKAFDLFILARVQCGLF